MVRLIICILLALFLIGCASTTTKYVFEIDSNVPDAQVVVNVNADVNADVAATVESTNNRTASGTFDGAVDGTLGELFK